MKDILIIQGSPTEALMKRFIKAYEKDINKALFELTKHASFIRNVRIKILIPQGTGRIDVQALCDEQTILGTAGKTYNEKK